MHFVLQFTLRNEWNLLLDETAALLYADGNSKYSIINTGFYNWMSSNPKIEIHLEQLLVYFLFTYFPGAVYDGEVYSKTKMAVYCVRMIKEIWMARWQCNGKELHIDEMTELVYRFSREVEHSDNNLKALEKML